ncbi:MAG: lamin tail domain-containing protein, partial [Candidatus Aenigmarchaeota archaeon]|nr:lamin tail domain-containing protein [Candidatus Aenigmarchaeota archaeon]
ETITVLDHIIINEFTTRGPNGSYDEFTELYNPTNNDINITGWKLQYKSALGDTWQSKVGSGITGIIKSRSFFLLASKSYSLSTTPDYLHTANWGLADTGGHLRIIDLNSTVIDKVGWGDANEPEGFAAPSLEEGKSLERKSLTTDTNNNSNDFILIAPTPRNSQNQ